MKTKSIEKEIFNRLKIVVGQSSKLIHKPFFKGNEKKYLNDCINSSFVSSSNSGKYIQKFENKIKKFTKSKFAISVINGTSGLHIAIKLITQENEEILVPALTFVGTCNSIIYAGAIPHFVDSNIYEYGVDFSKLDNYLSKITKIKSNKCYNKKTGRRISALILVHIFGHPANIEQALKISKKYKIKIIEDAAESIGSFYKKKHTGTFGSFGVISFNGNKSITTGGGGMILTNDKSLAKKARHLVNVAKVKHKYDYIHDEIGYNYAMPNINAALGCAQLENISKIIKFKRKLYLKYKSIFKDLRDVIILKESGDAISNYWLQTLILKNHNKKNFKKIINFINNKGYQVRPAWKLISEMKSYKKFPSMNLINSKKIRNSIINLPSSPELAT